MTVHGDDRPDDRLHLRPPGPPTIGLGHDSETTGDSEDRASPPARSERRHTPRVQSAAATRPATTHRPAPHGWKVIQYHGAMRRSRTADRSDHTGRPETRHLPRCRQDSDLDTLPHHARTQSPGSKRSRYLIHTTASETYATGQRGQRVRHGTKHNGHVTCGPGSRPNSTRGNNLLGLQS